MGFHNPFLKDGLIKFPDNGSVVKHVELVAPDLQEALLVGADLVEVDVVDTGVDGGLHLGAEAQLITGFSDSDNDTGTMTSAVAEGFAVGPMVGFKWVGDSGLSLVAQAGAQYMAVAATAESGSATAAQLSSAAAQAASSAR